MISNLDYKTLCITLSFLIVEKEKHPKTLSKTDLIIYPLQFLGTFVLFAIDLGFYFLLIRPCKLNFSKGYQMSKSYYEIIPSLV